MLADEGWTKEALAELAAEIGSAMDRGNEQCIGACGRFLGEVIERNTCGVPVRPYVRNADERKDLDRRAAEAAARRL